MLREIKIAAAGAVAVPTAGIVLGSLATPDGTVPIEHYIMSPQLYEQARTAPATLPNPVVSAIPASPTKQPRRKSAPKRAPKKILDRALPPGIGTFGGKAATPEPVMAAPTPIDIPPVLLQQQDLYDIAPGAAPTPPTAAGRYPDNDNHYQTVDELGRPVIAKSGTILHREKSTVHYSPTREVRIGTTFPVKAVIGQLDDTTIQELYRNEIDDDQQPVKGAVFASRTMKACLVGPEAAFTISPGCKTQMWLGQSEPLIWNWQVTAKTEGMHTLTIQMYNVTDTKAEEPLQEYNANPQTFRIKVTVGFLDSLSATLDKLTEVVGSLHGLVKALLGVITLITGSVLWKWWRKKSRSR